MQKAWFIACGRCKKKTEAHSHSRKYCDPCRILVQHEAEHAAHARARERRRRARLCTNCGQRAPEEGQLWCEACHLRSYKYADKRVGQIICLTCKKQIERGTHKSKYHKGCEKKHTPEWMRAYHKKRRDTAKKKGNCTRCLKKRARKNLTLCKSCADGVSNLQKRLYKEQQGRSTASPS